MVQAVEKQDVEQVMRAFGLQRHRASVFIGSWRKTTRSGRSCAVVPDETGSPLMGRICPEIRREKVDKQNGRGWHRLLRASACTWAGLHAAWVNEAAFREEALAALVFLPLGLWLGENGVEPPGLSHREIIIAKLQLLSSAAMSSWFFMYYLCK